MHARLGHSLLAALLLTASALPACSSGGSSGGGGGGAAGSIPASICARFARCFADVGGNVGAPATVDGFVMTGFDESILQTCSDAARAEGEATMAYELALPDIGAVDVAAAVRAIETTACDADFASAIELAKGARSEGRDCLADLQCASGACSGSNGACGACVKPIPTGGACVEGNPASVCERGYCRGGRCASDRQKFAGESCASSSECAFSVGLQCVAGTCTAVVAAVGESCASKPCRGSVCDATTKLCVARKQSGACTTTNECDIFGGFACSAATKTCTKFTGASGAAKAGEECGPISTGSDTRFVDCAAGLACVQAKCVSAASTCTAN